MRDFWTIAAAALVLCCFAVPAEGRGLRLDPDDRLGVVIVEFGSTTSLVRTNEHPDGAAAYIGFRPLSTSNSNTSDLLNGRTMLSLRSRPGDTALSYRAERVIAGTYVSEFVGSASWGICFVGRYRFDLRPGEAVFIGRLDRQMIAERLNRSMATGTLPSATRGSAILRSSGQIYLTPAPDLSDWESRVAQYIASEHPRITSPIRAAELEVQETECPESWSWFPTAVMFDDRPAGLH